MKFIVRLLPLLLMLYACEVSVDRPLPPHEPKMVLQAYLSPELPLALYLSRSYGPLERVTMNELLIKDANVQITVDGQPQSPVVYHDTLSFFGFEDSTGFYVVPDAQVASGQRIAFAATHPDYGTASGETTIPSGADITRIGVVQNAYREIFGPGDAYTQSLLQLQVADPPGEANYYRVREMYFAFRDPEFPQQQQYGAASILGPAVPSSDGGFVADGRYASDEANNGGPLDLEFVVELPNAYAPANDWREVIIDTIFLDLEFANEDYARYQEQLQLQRESSGGIQITPSEPVEPYDNIEGGFGAIGAFLTRRDTLVP